MPRQCLRDGAKALSLLGSLDGNVEFTSYLHLWKIGLEKLKYKCVGEILRFLHIIAQKSCNV